jgi:hypothetical protein
VPVGALRAHENELRPYQLLAGRGAVDLMAGEHRAKVKVKVKVKVKAPSTCWQVIIRLAHLMAGRQRLTLTRTPNLYA